MPISEKPHEANVPGPFYVCDGCCTACDVPFHGTPDLFSYDDQNHCYVSKQPESKSDTTRMIRTLLSSELECIRYGGSDPEVLRRLAESGNAHLSDVPIEGVDQLLRSHISFDAIRANDQLLTTEDLAGLFEQYILAQQSEYFPCKVTDKESVAERTRFSYSWFEDNFHPVEIVLIGELGCRWLVVSDTPFKIYDWLVAEARFGDIRCYTELQWRDSKEWQETPW